MKTESEVVFSSSAIGFDVYRLLRMHEMQPIVTAVRGVCLSVRQYVWMSVCHSQLNAPVRALCAGHSAQPLPNYFGPVVI